MLAMDMLIDSLLKILKAGLKDQKNVDVSNLRDLTSEKVVFT